MAQKTAGEICDDGNQAAGDGCSANCLAELGTDCTTHTECASAFCNALGKCGPASCVNSQIDVEETDIDCGGSMCDPCGLGENCAANRDCQSGVCDLLESNACEMANVCGNGTRESGEGCDDGSTSSGDGCNDICLVELGGACDKHAACDSGACLFEPSKLGGPPPPAPVCGPSHCNNSMLDGGESDVDCGGVDCAGCGPGRFCNTSEDCASYLDCFMGISCQEPCPAC